MNKVKGNVAVVGLGYVGLPLAVSFAKRLPVVGFDINTRRVAELQKGTDRTSEALASDLKNPNLSFTTDAKRLRECRYIVVAVPTPVDKANVPDLEPIISASRIVGENLAKGSIVIYESTVYPGVTEEICLPILEEKSGLKLGDFKIGYSPERINPGDHEHTIGKIEKIVSACDAETLDEVDALYSLVARSIYRAPSIATAEAAKVIENIQRDLNIALMNELSLIFSRLGLNTDEVLAAAGTKWNFHNYHPGLVGGHCIGVDPYYLTYRAQQFGYHPQVILAGRQINDSMPIHVGEMVVKGIAHVGKPIKGATVLILGLTFKENVPDLRNSKVHNTITYLQGFGVKVLGYEPLLSADTVRKYFGIENVEFDKVPKCDCIVVANKHDAFRSLTLDQLKTKMSPPVLIDIKNLFDRHAAQAAGFYYTSL
ncbi:MAG: nucleotide sugar dehydrogenase [Verrucomicrobiia bacterium]|jgi:UDP-N-acetyl-D-galactosamine dehydrogenase